MKFRTNKFRGSKKRRKKKEEKPLSWPGETRMRKPMQPSRWEARRRKKKRKPREEEKELVDG